MKATVRFFTLLIALATFSQISAQGLILGNSENQEESTLNSPSCGSFEYMKHVDSHNAGFMNNSDNFALKLKKIVKKKQHQKSGDDLFRIPVVFHIVYNNEQENLADSVIQDQLRIINESFRRTNADTIDTRPEFLPYVGDANIEFFLAETDPDGLPTTGITRTNSDIEHFGGVLPYAATQTAEITTWVNDSLFFNFFRITRDDLGGIDPWDPERYMNIWLGDLRIFEPEINNFEELVFFGLATPPIDHYNWPIQEIGPLLEFNQGLVMHYVAIGSNNPNSYPPPYQAFNSSMKAGKITVHEVGHYLGLRHIWGDGNCSADDFIDDTPLASAGGTFNCNFNANTCTDDIDGIDLPNMVENYMDYSSGQCQNSFTNGQIDIMREVLLEYRPELAEIILSTEELTGTALFSETVIYPNPINQTLNISTSVNEATAAQIEIHDSMGRLVIKPSAMTLSSGHNSLTLDVSTLDNGVYYFSLTTLHGKVIKTLIKN